MLHLHHIVACGLVAYNIYDGTPKTDYYLYHLGGFGEIPTIFLCFVDTFKNIPRLRSMYPITNYYARISFGISFLFVRCVWWTYIIFNYDDDNIFIYGFLYSLIFIQYTWAKKIVDSLLQLIPICAQR